MPVGRPRSGVDLKRQIEGNADFLVEHAAEQKRGPGAIGKGKAPRALGSQHFDARFRGAGGGKAIGVAESQLRANTPPTRKRRKRKDDEGKN